MKSESSCGALCQHPECWRANLQRVKDAVRQRNGLHTQQTLEHTQPESRAERADCYEDGSLPTLKVVNMFGESDLGDSFSQFNGPSPQSNPYYQRSTSLPSLSPNPSQPLTPSYTPTVPVPRPSPVTPTVLTDYQKRMLWKRNVQSAPDRTSTNYDKQQASVVCVHELYENDELLQDWRDVYITSAYLVWCQTNRRKKRKAKSTGSIRKDPRRVTFKDVTEDMIPAGMEKIQPKRPEPRRSPTVGLPYSPSRASSHRRVHVQHLDLANYGLEDFGDFPKSVIAGILQHLKPNKEEGDKKLPLGLQAHPKQQSSPRARDAETKSQRTDRNELPKTTDALLQTLEQTVNDESSRMLLNIDINSHITPPLEEPMISEEGRDTESSSSKQGTNAEPKIVTVTRENLTARRGRFLLPLTSVGVPTPPGPKVKLNHCMNSIPRILDLGVAMEPVEVVSVTPTPTGTPDEEAVVQDSQLCLIDDLPMERVPSATGPASPNYDRYRLVRGHVTSALRYSPSPVRAPAPTPISPERYGQYGRTRELSSSIASRQMRHREEIRSVNDRDELSANMEALGSPHEEGDEIAIAESVFITEGVTHDPTLTPVSVRKDREEWPEEKMIINIIENEDDFSRLARSPSPGSKTCIPRDILAEFRGDLFGRKTMLIAGQKMTEKQRIAEESGIVSDAPAYIAPAWRTPRSRTPIQFSETPSRKAPKPLRQPPAESVPRSLTVQPIAKRTLQRPKSTPPRRSSSCDSVELPLQQILSDSSLMNTSRDNIESQSIVVQASPSSVNTCGSIPPPPSPEVPIAAAMATRLDPLSEVEEKSSLASASIADGTSLVEDREDDFTNQAEENVDNEEVKFQQKTDKVELERNKEGTDVLEVTKTVEKVLDETEEPPKLKSQHVGYDPLSSDEKLTLQKSETLDSETKQNHSHAGSEGGESVEAREGFVNRIEESAKSGDTKKPNEESMPPPHPPESPDIINTPDFTEGLDMTLDLGAELRAAMEGLDNLDENDLDDVVA